MMQIVKCIYTKISRKENFNILKHIFRVIVWLPTHTRNTIVSFLPYSWFKKLYKPCPEYIRDQEQQLRNVARLTTYYTKKIKTKYC